MSSDNESTPSNPKISGKESISPANDSPISDHDPISPDNDSPNLTMNQCLLQLIQLDPIQISLHTSVGEVSLEDGWLNASMQGMLKVSQFQNVLLVSSNLPKKQRNFF